MSDLDKPLRDAVWQAHELAIRMRGLLDSTRGPSVTVPTAELERLIVNVSFIGGYRLAELDKVGATRASMADALLELADFIKSNTDKDGDISRTNLTFIYRRLQAMYARAKGTNRDKDR